MANPPVAYQPLLLQDQRTSEERVFRATIRSMETVPTVQTKRHVRVYLGLAVGVIALTIGALVYLFSIGD